MESFDHLMAARSTMGFSLGFHIIFASVGMVMPFFMATSHFLFLKYENRSSLDLTKMWAKGVAVLFATGAVSGTVLSFELGLLWPGFMKYAGPLIGMPFSWEGTAFFLEAIAIGIFFYGWQKLPRWIHWSSGCVVGVAGVASGIFVIAANSWMNTPTGFRWENGQALDIDPVAALFNPHWFQQSLHMILAAFVAVGFAVAGLHGIYLLKGKNPELNRLAMKIALTFASITALMQPLSGHLSAQKVAQYQPAKLAAMEAHFKTERGASLFLGGIPDVDEQKVYGALEIPGALSFMAFDDFNAEVKGLDQFPREEWPAVRPLHFAFQIMVALGTLLALFGAFLLFQFYYRQRVLSFPVLKLLIFCTPLGFIALECGWFVTEVGRQPWILYGFLKTSEAVSPVPGLTWHFSLFFLIYLALAFFCGSLMFRLIQSYQNNPQVSHDH